MQIAVFGTGMVGQTIAGKLAERGQGVIIGTRDVAKTMAQTGTGQSGQLALRSWHAGYPTVQLGTFAEAAQYGEIIFNATNGMNSLEALQQAGAEHLDGKILIDIANPLDFSRGMPPTLAIVNTDSLGEQLQRAFPAVKVVKALNTMTAAVMVDPALVANGDHHLFMCGNDADAKAQVADALTNWFGWTHIIDLGDITAARGTEMCLPIWLRLWGALGTPMFNFKIVQ